mmetsp:Transcript_13184/g.28616  ORF Transcript_13184/g.28616 Transcript_13184/m.28616 type:complete len:231 (+) Transcript_13184:81-773(+)
MEIPKPLTHNKQSMKYLLFDLATLIYFVLVARKLLCDGHSSLLAPARHPDQAYANQTCIPVEQQPQQYGAQDEDGVQVVINASSSSEDVREPLRMSSLDPTSNEDSTFSVGDIVELYGDNSKFAQPAIITGHKIEESSTEYNLHLLIAKTDPSGVTSEFIHRYQVYDAGTKASCNVGTLEVYMADCWIVSHSIEKSGLISYQVSYLDEEKKLHSKYLPLTSVQRIIIQNE